MDARIAAARAKLGKDVVLLGHHYQRDEVIRFADFTGDSYKLSKVAAETARSTCCSAACTLWRRRRMCWAQPWQQVILPDLNAGCSMADMAEIGQVEDCWDALERAGLTAEGTGLIPLTYMNSAANIKAFCGERGGLVCTSSNARGAFEWAFARAEKILFLPDQHLGRNTAFAMGIPLSEMVVWDPYQINGGVAPDRLKAAKVILWKGHCSVHQRFLPEHVDRVRREVAGDAGDRASGVPLGGLPEGRCAGLDGADHQGDRGCAGGFELCRGHGDSPGEPAGEAVCAAGQAGDYAGRHGLPVHDDVSHLAAASGVGAGEPGGGPRGEPHQGARRM